MPATQTHIDTRDAILRQVEELRAAGWTALRCDDFERAMIGFCVFRHVLASTKETIQHLDQEGAWARMDGTPIQISQDEVMEEERILQWPIYDRPLTPDVALIDPEELWAMLEADQDVFQCDDPRARQLGFVWHKPAEGRSIVRRVTLTKIKGDAPSAKAILAFRTNARVLSPSNFVI